jgi:AAA domain
MSGFTLSTTSGRRLCKINGGRLHNKTIYLYDKNYKCCMKHNNKCNGECCNNCCFYDYHNDDDEDEDIKYCKIPDGGQFVHLPTNEPTNTDVNYYTGMRGSGKSTAMAEFAKEYKKLYPKNKVFLFSQKREDPTLDPYIDKRIDIDTFIEKGGLKVDDFKHPSLVIFDDIDMLKDTKENGKLKSAIWGLMNSLIQLSRSKGITVCQTSHIATNHEETKHVLNGCTTFTFFLHAVNKQIKNALELYMGLTKEQIKRLLELKNTRRVTLFHICPTIVMTDKELFIL